MDSIHTQPDQLQTQAVDCLRQISNHSDPLSTLLPWSGKKPSRRPPRTHPNRNHRNSLDQALLKRPRPLQPLYPHRHNPTLPVPVTPTPSTHTKHYVLFEKGLGAFGSLGGRRRQQVGGYWNESSKFIRVVSESAESEIELVKQWLNLKKQHCKSFNRVMRKGKTRTGEGFGGKSINVGLRPSIKNIL